MDRYELVTAGDADKLAADVNRLIGMGFEPVGGISVSSHFEQWENSCKGYTESETFVLYAQAMVCKS